MNDVVVIGAGASGLMLCSLLPNHKICLIEKNSTQGAKIKVSGGAKCNITNRYMSGDFFLSRRDILGTLKEFSQNHLLTFLNKNGVFPKIKDRVVKGAYFCNKSTDVVNMFQKLTKHCDFMADCEVLDVCYKDCFCITTTKGVVKSKRLVVASGGLSFVNLGATDIGYKIAKHFGHNIIKTDPALVGFTVQKEQFWFKKLSGLSLDVRIFVGDKIIDGAMLFTHKGCSGPAILSASIYWQKGHIRVDFAPNKNDKLPKRFLATIKDIDIDIHNYLFSPAGNFGYTKAEVTKGGVSLDEVDDRFESKLYKGLYFVGEVLDVTGELGGYNFQWAFSSAFCCANGIKNSY
jgi:predicted Rossmann fold flavoprotein